MRILKLGIVKVHKELSELADGWDGYSGLAITKEVLEAMKNMSFVDYVMSQFRKLGFEDIDIEVTPCSNGYIQFEAEKDNIYLGIEVNNKYYKDYLHKLVVITELEKIYMACNDERVFEIQTRLSNLCKRLKEK